MKKLSLAGLLLGSLVGIVVVLVFGKWLFWLGMGLVIGILIGTAVRRTHSSNLPSHPAQQREGAKS
jgi:uncharacterized transporter YbjL